MEDKIRRVRKLLKLCDGYLTKEEDWKPKQAYHMAEVPIDREDMEALKCVLNMATGFLRIRDMMQETWEEE